MSAETTGLRLQNLTSVIESKSCEEIIETILAAAKESEENLEAAETLFSSLFVPNIPPQLANNKKSIKLCIKNGISYTNLSKVDANKSTVLPKRLSAVLANPILAFAFRAYLKSCFSDENITFWFLVEKYRARFTSKLFLLPFLVDIYNDFVSESGSNTVNISSEQRNSIQTMVQQAVTAAEMGESKIDIQSRLTVDALDIAQEEVGELLASSLPKFRKSALYKEAMEQQEKIDTVEQLEVLSLPDLTIGPVAPGEWSCILANAKTVNHKWGEEILTNLEFCHHLYILVKGELSFTYSLVGETEKRTITLNERGMLFGEFSMLGVTLRSIYTVSVVSQTAILERVDIPFLYSYFKCSPYVGIRFFNAIIQNSVKVKDKKEISFVVAELSATMSFTPHPELSNQLILATFKATMKKKMEVNVFITAESLCCYHGNSLVEQITIDSTSDVEQKSKGANTLTLQLAPNKKIRLECENGNRDDYATILSLLRNRKKDEEDEEEEKKFIGVGRYSPSFTTDMWKMLQHPPCGEASFTYFRNYQQRDLIIGKPSKMLTVVLHGSCVVMGDGIEPLDLSEGSIFEGNYFATIPLCSLRCCEDNTNILFINGDYLRKIFAERQPDITMRLYYQLAKQFCYRTSGIFAK